MSLKELSAKLYPAFMKNFPTSSAAPCRLFLSATNMKERAAVRQAVGDTPEKAWTIALTELEKALKGITPSILRADWVTSSETSTWADCLEKIKSARRNCFRRGIAFDKDYRVALTEQELNANLILYPDDKENPNGEFRVERAEDYCRQRFGFELPKISAADEVELFDTAGGFIQDKLSEPLTITGKGSNVGLRDMPKSDADFFLKLARTGGNYLAQQCNKKGKFVYELYPCDDSTVPSYNSMRHFDTLYSMMEVYETYGKIGGMTLGKAISRGLEYGIKNFVRYRKLPDGSEAAYIDEQKQLKLGSSGAALRALEKWSALQHTKKYLPLMRSLARGIFTFQRNDGSFVHVLNADDYTLKEEFRLPAYDSEAILGLMRLYAMTQDKILLESATRAFDYFTSTDYRKSGDPLLSYAASELTLYKPEEKYFEFGLNNCLPYLPSIYERDIYLPNIFELLMATHKIMCRMKSLPEMSKLSERVDWDFFCKVLNEYAEQILGGHFWAETAMYFKNPERILGSFFIRHQLFRIRIDDVQHYLSGFIAYCKYLGKA